MDTNALSRSDDQSARPNRRVRIDLLAGMGLLATVVVGKLVWQASDLGILAALGAR